MKKTTKEDFALFEESCRIYLELFGFSEWTIEFKHKDPSEEIAGAFAYCYADLEQMVSELGMAVSYDEDNYEKTEEFITECAMHEVAELLLMPLNLVSSDRYTTPDKINRERHGIINKLTNIMKRFEAQ